MVIRRPSRGSGSAAPGGTGHTAPPSPPGRRTWCGGASPRRSHFLARVELPPQWRKPAGALGALALALVKGSSAPRCDARLRRVSLPAWLGAGRRACTRWERPSVCAKVALHFSSPTRTPARDEREGVGGLLLPLLEVCCPRRCVSVLVETRLPGTSASSSGVPPHPVVRVAGRGGEEAPSCPGGDRGRAPVRSRVTVSRGGTVAQDRGPDPGRGAELLRESSAGSVNAWVRRSPAPSRWAGGAYEQGAWARPPAIGRVRRRGAPRARPRRAGVRRVPSGGRGPPASRRSGAAVVRRALALTAVARPSACACPARGCGCCRRRSCSWRPRASRQMFKSLFNKDGQGKGGRSAGAEETSHYQKEMIEPSTIDSFELGPILGTGRYVAAAADARAESAGAPAPIRRTCTRSRRRRTDWPPLAPRSRARPGTSGPAPGPRSLARSLALARAASAAFRWPVTRRRSARLRSRCSPSRRSSRRSK